MIYRVNKGYKGYICTTIESGKDNLNFYGKTKKQARDNAMAYIYRRDYNELVRNINLQKSKKVCMK